MKTPYRSCTFWSSRHHPSDFHHRTLPSRLCNHLRRATCTRLESRCTSIPIRAGRMPCSRPPKTGCHRRTAHGRPSPHYLRRQRYTCCAGIPYRTSRIPPDNTHSRHPGIYCRHHTAPHPPSRHRRIRSRSDSAPPRTPIHFPLCRQASNHRYSAAGTGRHRTVHVLRQSTRHRMWPHRRLEIPCRTSHAPPDTVRNSRHY